MRVFIFIFICILLNGGCTPINKKLGLSDNHFFEEIFEFVLSEKTGIDADLSDTPEN